METLGTGGGKKRGKPPPRIAHLEEAIGRHRTHVGRLEALMRLLDNGGLPACYVPATQSLQHLHLLLTWMPQPCQPHRSSVASASCITTGVRAAVSLQHGPTHVQLHAPRLAADMGVAAEAMDPDEMEGVKELVDDYVERHEEAFDEFDTPEDLYESIAEHLDNLEVHLPFLASWLALSICNGLWRAAAELPARGAMTVLQISASNASGPAGAA